MCEMFWWKPERKKNRFEERAIEEKTMPEVALNKWHQMS
jgi:hypothetical protein